MNPLDVLISQNVMELPNRETCQEPCSKELGMCGVFGRHCVSENSILSPKSCNKCVYTQGFQHCVLCHTRLIIFNYFYIFKRLQI